MIVQFTCGCIKVLGCNNGFFFIPYLSIWLPGSLWGCCTCALIDLKIIKFSTWAKVFVCCVYLVTSNASCLTGKLVGKWTVYNILVCCLINCFVKLFLTIICNEITQSVNFILSLLRASQNVLHLGGFHMVTFSLSIVVTPEARWSSCLSLINSATSLGYAIAASSLTFIGVVVVWLVYCCASVCEKVVYFLWVRNSCTTVSTDRSHRKLINLLSLYRSLLAHGLSLNNTLWRRLVHNKISTLAFSLAWSICGRSSLLRSLISFCLRKINEYFVHLSVSTLTLNFSSIWHPWIWSLNLRVSASL